MAKTVYRNNNTYLIEGNQGDNPKLMGQALSDGRDSLYLEFYLGYDEVESKNGKTYKKIRRATERLGLYLWQAPRTPDERRQNKETLEIAKRLRFERGQELLQEGEGYRLKKKNDDINFINWMWQYADNYTKSDKRVIIHAINNFISYLIDPTCELIPQKDWSAEKIAQVKAKKEKRIAELSLKPNEVTKSCVSGFADYLVKRFKGDGPRSTFKRFKKILLAAHDADVLAVYPCKKISIKTDEMTLRKDILSEEEIKQLIATHCPGENINVRRAFIFCLYTGLRWCDVKRLTFANVDFSNRLLKFEQAKTNGGVVIPLNKSLLSLIGGGDRNELIFSLPSNTACLKALRHWVACAGIDKHITWHCARHSFAVNILNRGANIKTVASLLGHSGLSQTEKYTRAIDSLKEAAINSLPELEL